MSSIRGHYNQILLISWLAMRLGEGELFFNARVGAGDENNDIFVELLGRDL
jgi:hypothetical protein